MNLKYIKHIIDGVGFDKLKMCIDEVHEKSGKNKAAIFFDMASCAVRYGAGYYDYLEFEFQNVPSKERKNFMTRMKNKKMVLMLNDPAYSDIFDKKNQFYTHFRDFLGRDFLDLEKADIHDIRKFVEGKEYIIAKPNDGEGGHGIEKIKISDFENFNTLYAYLTSKEKGFGVIEEVLVQHPEMSRIYPYSVNCYRLVTLLHEGEVHLLYAMFKTGNNGSFVDNSCSGGYAAHFDPETGLVCGPGHDIDRVIVRAHPMTSVEFEGFRPPCSKEAIELVKKAALVVPQVKYIGWDVCVTENGPAIIEGNNYAAYDLAQLPDEGKPQVGMLKQVRDIGLKL